MGAKRCGLLALILGLTPGLLLVSGLTAAPPDPALNTSIAHLRMAVHPVGRVNHLDMLSSLRQLGDPTLRSFFLQLAQQGDSMARIHAILGLAEIEDDGRIDPWLVSQLESADARYIVIDNAAQLDLMDAPQIKELLGWNDLEAKARALLAAELLTREETLDRDALKTLAGHERLAVSGLAAAVLAQLGDTTPFETWRQRLEAAPAVERITILRDLLAAIEIYELTATLDWVAEIVEQYAEAPLVVAEGLMTMLKLDPKRGVALWNSALGSDPDYRRQISFAMLLLNAARHIPPESFDVLRTDDPLLDAVAAAGHAVAGGEGAASALIELSEIGHIATTAWVLTTARELDVEQATRVYSHMLEQVEKSESEDRVRRTELAIIAAAHLFDVNPGVVAEKLVNTPDDSLTQQAILMGMLESRNPDIGEITRRLKRIGYGVTDSLTMLLIAKHAETLSEEELRSLGVLASGGGQLTGMLQAQAAWLYLKHTSNIEQALVDLFATAEERS